VRCSIINYENSKKCTKIGIVTSPFLLKAGAAPLSNLIQVLGAYSSKIYVLSGNLEALSIISDSDKIKIIVIQQKIETNLFKKVFKYVVSNLKISIYILYLYKTDIWFFYLGETLLLIPILITRFLNKKAILVSSGSLRTLRQINNSKLSRIIIKKLENISPMLASKILISSKNLVCAEDLIKFGNKLIFLYEHFVDTNAFDQNIKIKNRQKIVGFVGRLSYEKGILNFLEAIHCIAAKDSDIKFIIAGSGPLDSEINHFINRNLLKERVKLLGWIPHNALPELLNQLKLLVIPSYTETGPLVLLEAMACGTPVAATLVGLVSNLVEDEFTGFILENNSPECIAFAITRALEYPKLDLISSNARELIEKEYTYDATIVRYRKLFEIIQ